MQSVIAHRTNSFFPSLNPQDLQESEYILGEYSALDREQKQIDERAAFVEKALRQAMEEGQWSSLNIFTFQSKLKTYQMILIYHVAQWLHTRGIAAKSFNVQLMGSKCDRMPYSFILGTMMEN